ncbi:MAG: glycosyltransferase [Myxococcota bacterium]
MNSNSKNTARIISHNVSSMIQFHPSREESPELPERGNSPALDVDILVPIHNEWHVLRPCLDSLEAFTNVPGIQITILDDGSDVFVQQRLETWLASGGIPKRILRNEVALGFVKNSNRGFRESTASRIVLLNSDTVVTPGWLDAMMDVMDADDKIACVMPMSNQCSMHSLEVPMGWNIFQYAADVRRKIKPIPFDAVTVGGFCLLMRREALDDVGGYDEIFGMGYGEESDWCMRARSRGWKVTGLPNTFVYHRGKATFKDYKQKTFKQKNYKTFMARWSEPYSKAMAQYHEIDALATLREAYVRIGGSSPPPVLSAFVDRMKTGGTTYATTEAVRYVRDQGGIGRVPKIVSTRGLIRRRSSEHPFPQGFQSNTRPRITYVLEKFSVSGGVLSVVQLVNRLTLLGWDAKIVTHHEHDQEKLGAYMLYHQPYIYPTVEDMIKHFPESDIIVATLWSTAAKVRRIIDERQPRAIPWYFVQDDETRFFHDLDTGGRARVMESYKLVPNMIVKSEWLRAILAERGHDSHKVGLGLDLDLFYPESQPDDRPLRILAMTRPQTPRRGFSALMNTLAEVKRLRPAVEVLLYGCDDLSDYNIPFEHENLGLIPSDRLRRIYSDASILLDLSDFQGLGRMGLEAMACGCATVLTKFGGIAEYSRPGINCFSVDPASLSETVDATIQLIDNQALRRSFVAEGFRTAQQFSCDAEARTMSRLFSDSLGIEPDVSVGATKRIARPDTRLRNPSISQSPGPAPRGA